MGIELGRFGIRTRPFNIHLNEQVLVVGLGEVGLLAIAKLKAMLEQTIPPRQRAEHIRLFAITARKSIRQEQLLPRENRLLLKPEPVRWSDVPGRFVALGVAKWWARTPNHTKLQLDPTPTRPYGRLLLWTNVEVVSETLFDLVDWLKVSSQHQNKPARVFIIGSLAEPEGSGMIFDISGRIRLLLQGQAVPIVGVFSADSPFENDDERLQSMARVYATLKELDSANLRPEVYQHDLPRVHRTQTLPLDHPHRLFEHICITGDVSRQSVDTPEGAITEFTITWLLHLLQNNPTPQHFLPPPDGTTASLNRYSAYTVFGVAKLALPVEEVLQFNLIRVAKGVLHSMLMPYPEPVDNWVQKVLTRAHGDLLSQTLLQQHPITDRIKELDRRISYKQLTASYKRVSQSTSDVWERMVNREWELLQRENEAFEADKDGISIPRDVLRRRMTDALEEGSRALNRDVEQLAVNLAFGDGWGLKWTLGVFDNLLAQIASALDKMNSNLAASRQQFRRIGKQWVNAAHTRQTATWDKLQAELMDALGEWVGLEARIAAWEEFNQYTQEIRERLELANQQVMTELGNLDEAKSQLEQSIQRSMLQGPQFPAATFVYQNWVDAGVGSLPPTERVAPHDLISSVFKRWQAGDTPPIRQLQKFLSEVLYATRLTLQSYTNFQNIHDAIHHYPNPNSLQRLIASIGAAAAPLWTISAVTDRLDQPFIPPLAIDIDREAPNPFNVLPQPNQGRIQRLNIPSPDPDEVVNIRITHGWSAEHVQKLRNDYRRAYYRVTSDNIPLHIDRRWETTMADLVHTTIRSEVSNLWDIAVKDILRGPRYAQESVTRLSRALASALEATLENIQEVSPLVEDIWLHIYPLQPFRLKIPPPHCTFVFMMSYRNPTDVTEDLMRTITNTMPEENFLFVVNLAERNDLSRILEPIQAQGFMPLELNSTDIKHIISAPKPSNALRDVVIDRINLSAISPFYTRAPVPDHMFFGREKEIADVRSKLSTHSVVLIGGRRIGKTSTLQKIYRTLQQADSPQQPHYLDCSNMFKHSHFFRRISQEWGITVDDMNDPIEFDMVVQELQRRNRGQAPVFLLDEVDRLLKTDQGNNFDEPLFRTFRTLSNEKQCQFVFSGEKLLLGSLSNAHSVLFNFPQKVKLSPLDKEVVQRLVTEPFEMLNIWLEDVDDLIQRMYEISAGHPNIVQTICHALVEVVDKEKHTNLLTRKHLGIVLDWHHVQLDIVETIWGQMDPLAKLLTLIWPENTRQMTMEQMITLIRRTGIQAILTQYVKEIVIPDLILYNFIQQEGQHYTLIPVLFPTILDEMTNKEMEIRTIVELHQEQQVR